MMNQTTNTNTMTNNPSFPFALCVRMQWSKNISEEREAPQQIMLGSMDPRVCVLLNLAAYVEFLHIVRLQEQSPFLFGKASIAQQTIRKVLQVTTSQAEKIFDDIMGLIGTHSFRKGPATYASRCGLAREVIAKRGRWRNNKRMVDIYIDINVPLPDAQAAAKLCGPSGACKYSLRKNTHISNSWLLRSATPGIQEAFGTDVAKTLALPLLWAAFDDHRVDMLHLDSPPAPHIDPLLKQRILEAYVSEYGAVTDDLPNPVLRVNIIPQGHGAQLNMMELHRDPDDETEENENEPRSDMPNEEATTAIISQQITTHRRVEEVTSQLMNELGRISLGFSRQFSNIHRAIKRIALQPVLRPARSRTGSSISDQSTNVNGGRECHARLYRGVKNLWDLWQEYEYGLGGNKPARDFTRQERGHVKFVYSRRKVFWEVMCKLVRAGHTSDSAIDLIYDIYGQNRGVTEILRRLAIDRRNGEHTRLEF